MRSIKTSYSDAVGDFKKAYQDKMQPLQLDTLRFKKCSGHYDNADYFADGQANGFMDWLKGRQRTKGVTYR